ncbi:MAG TPA: pyridoxamine 5'-phosphate oxidase [Ginsengibacter sp.]|nr:pyridoxamine 5'-phosphate oxidase [Chitinophagaceae bacterium]MCZ2395233.1 pyridoxamine 5'-phosphate oxidase [Chitinophagales bacterium]HRP17602.1 pyridoxamine 5'-phosphate oxidase [Ginsengibacter sp.]HRP43575.1 pyridoxamine 5'-phosphate oxidase [Ginsengibacter sp.]
MSVDLSISDIRKVYKQKSLSEKDVKANPVEQFHAWWDEAMGAHIDEVNAMTLATCTTDGRPSARIVLLKGIDREGFVFFTNYTSRKGTEIENNPRVALLFFWKELERQVRIEGNIEKIDEADSDTYFHSRPVESRIGAWVSPQSSTIPGRDFLEERRIETELRFKDSDIARPPFWGGYIVHPLSIEFWQGRPGRLHDRILYTKKDNNWTINRLAP